MKHESIRFVFLKESLNYILKRPIFGYGTGSFGAIFKREVKSGYNYDIKTTPHNNYLYVYFELGIFGFIIFILIFYFQIKSLYRNNNFSIHRVILPFFYLVILSIKSCFVSPLLYDIELSTTTR